MSSLAEFALRVLWSLDTIRSVSVALAKVGMKVFNSPHSPIHYVAQYVDRRWHIALRSASFGTRDFPRSETPAFPIGRLLDLGGHHIFENKLTLNRRLSPTAPRRCQA